MSHRSNAFIGNLARINMWLLKRHDCGVLMNFQEMPFQVSAAPCENVYDFPIIDVLNISYDAEEPRGPQVQKIRLDLPNAVWTRLRSDMNITKIAFALGS
jgi:hypothetical protein